MKNFIAVMAWNANNRVIKYQDYDLEADADAHVLRFVDKFPEAFVAPKQGDNTQFWLVDPILKTLSFDNLIINSKFRRSDGLYLLESSIDEIPSHDPGTEIVIQVAIVPDVRLDRWDGATGVRVATAQETIDYDDSVNDVKATVQLNTPVNIVIRDIFWDLTLQGRAAGQDFTTIPELLANNATTKNTFTVALKNLVKDKQ